MVALVRADRRSPIIHPDPKVPSNAVEGWTDAAGGTTSHQGAGVGSLIPPFFYYFLSWPAWLNLKGANSEGVVFASKLTCLELLGGLVLLVTCGEVAAGGHLRLFINNQGAVDVFRKGHSTKCMYTSAVAKAMHEVAEAIGVTVTVEKVRRVSDRGSYTADMLSKGNLQEAMRMAAEVHPEGSAAEHPGVDGEPQRGHGLVRGPAERHGRQGGGGHQPLLVV